MASENPFAARADENGKRLFDNKDALTGDDHSRGLAARESEAATLEGYIEDALTETKPLDALVAGPNGSGKTTTIFHALDSLADVQRVRVDCHAGPDPYHLSLKLVNELRDDENKVKRGTQRADVYRMLWEEVQSRATDRELAVVFVFENIDCAVDVTTVLDQIAEANRDGTLDTVNVVSIGTATEDVSLADIDVAASTIQFDSYSASDVQRILGQRLPDALRETTVDVTESGVDLESDVLSRAAFDTAVEATVESFNSDVRYAFRIVRRAGKLAERESGDSCITIRHVERAVDKLS